MLKQYDGNIQYYEFYANHNIYMHILVSITLGRELKKIKIMDTTFGLCI